MSIRSVCVAFIAAGSVLVSSCSTGSSPQPEQRGQSPAATSPGATATPTTAAPQRKTIQLGADEGYRFFGHFLLKSGEAGDFYTTSATTLYLPGYGEINLDAESLMPGAEVLAQSYASAGTEQDPRIVAAIEVGEPARDLNPPSTVVRLLDIDPETRNAVKNVEVRRYDTPGSSGKSGATLGLAGSSGSVVAVSVHNPAVSNDPFQTVAFDLATEKEVWNKPGRLVQRTFKGDGVIVRHEPASTAERFCPRDSLTNTVTGQEVLGVGGEYTGEFGYVNCLRLSEMAFPAAGILAVNADASNNGSKVTNTAYEFGANREVKLDPHTKQVDERSELILAQRYDDEPIEIRNRVTGQVVYTIDETTIENVSLRPQRLFDKKLWVTTTDEKLILDATNGNTLERGWTSYPTYLVDDWVLWTDGRLVPTS